MIPGLTIVWGLDIYLYNFVFNISLIFYSPYKFYNKK